MISRARLIDVARECGVSKATVSRILNDPGERDPFNKVTRRRVVETARRLGYQPSHRARAFARGRSEAIGVLYGGALPTVGHVYESFFASFVEEVHRRACHLAFLPARYAMEDWDRLVLPERVDALVAVEAVDPECVVRAERAGLPLVTCNADPSAEHDSVVFDDYQGACLATQHLLDLGHRDIRFWLVDSGHYSVEQRCRGFADTMARAGVDVGGERVFRTENTQALPFVERCLACRPRPTGLLVYNHYQAVEVLKVLHGRGVRVPREMSVVTFNDAYPCEHVIPPLTTVHLPFDRMGRIAAEMVFRKIDDRDSRCERVVLPERLVVRESSAAASAVRSEEASDEE
ncbi:MAG: LacI family transcriptional regulator [Phycisphaerae bacterium]|nr:LacI family transcriptional regulator [Phycisphaerae bacterium]